MNKSSIAGCFLSLPVFVEPFAIIYHRLHYYFFPAPSNPIEIISVFLFLFCLFVVWGNHVLISS